MWKRFVLIIVAGIMGFVQRGAADEPTAKTLPSKDEVRKAIRAFQVDPTRMDSTGQRLAIMRFAQESTEVRVVIDPKPVPWFEDKKLSDNIRTNLLTSYIAGNVLAQLDKGKAENDSVAGDVQVIATYRQLQKAEPGLDIPEVEKLAELQKQGKLAEYLSGI